MNQIENNDLKTIYAIAKHLRVPELSYRIAESEEFSNEIDFYFDHLTYSGGGSGSESALKDLVSGLGKKSLPAKLNNLAFISDRIFDVWGRKNKLNSDIQDILKTWRHPFFKVMCQCADPKLIAKFIVLVDAVSNDVLGWEPRPERSKRIFLDELNNISEALFNLDCQTEKSLDSILAQWQVISEKQASKTLKISQRLALLEDRKSWEEYTQSYAKSYINTLLTDQVLSESLQKFVSVYWVKVLAQSIEKTKNSQINEDLQTLSAKIKAVFCTKGKAAHKWVDNLLEDLQSKCTDHDIKVEASIWQAIEMDLVKILQGGALEENQFVSCDDIRAWSRQPGDDINKAVIVGQWLCSVNDSIECRERVVAIIPEAKEVLTSNYLGIKVRRCSFEDLNGQISSHSVKPLIYDSSLLEVVKKNNAGLLKVALTQQKARAVAADKARKEAEALLQEKQKAEKMAQIKAAEIAEQTKQLLKKQKDKQRAEEEHKAQIQVADCKLGAWISVVQADDESNNPPQRFKLVVRFAASNKFIFVDKLGVKKLELTEASLIEGVVNKTIEMLSDGAEFEDSLERVVSRLRISK